MYSSMFWPVAELIGRWSARDSNNPRFFILFPFTCLHTGNCMKMICIRSGTLTKSRFRFSGYWCSNCKLLHSKRGSLYDVYCLEKSDFYRFLLSSSIVYMFLQSPDSFWCWQNVWLGKMRKLLTWIVDIGVWCRELSQCQYYSLLFSLLWCFSWNSKNIVCIQSGTLTKSRFRLSGCFNSGKTKVGGNLRLLLTLDPTRCCRHEISFLLLCTSSFEFWPNFRLIRWHWNKSDCEAKVSGSSGFAYSEAKSSEYVKSFFLESYFASRFGGQNVNAVHLLKRSCILILSILLFTCVRVLCHTCLSCAYFEVWFSEVYADFIISVLLGKMLSWSFEGSIFCGRSSGRLNGWVVAREDDRVNDVGEARKFWQKSLHHFNGVILSIDKIPSPKDEDVREI